MHGFLPRSAAKRATPSDAWCITQGLDMHASNHVSFRLNPFLARRYVQECGGTQAEQIAPARPLPAPLPSLLTSLLTQSRFSGLDSIYIHRLLHPPSPCPSFTSTTKRLETDPVRDSKRLRSTSKLLPFSARPRWPQYIQPEFHLPRQPKHTVRVFLAPPPPHRLPSTAMAPSPVRDKDSAAAEPMIDPELADLPPPPHHSSNGSNGSTRIPGEPTSITESIASAPNPHTTDFSPLPFTQDESQIPVVDDEPGSPTARLLRALAPPNAAQPDPKWPPVSSFPPLHTLTAPAPSQRKCKPLHRYVENG